MSNVDVFDEDLPDPGAAEADEAALRALLTRLRGQIADAEAQAYAEWQDLRAEVSDRDREEFQTVARAVARRQSAAASELQGLSGELRVMADSLLARRGGADLRIDALVRMAAEVSDSADQLAFRVAEGQSWAAEAMDRLSERLGRLEAVATDRSARQLERLAVRIDESEARRGREFSAFFDALERRRAERAIAKRAATPVNTVTIAPPRRQSNHRPAAALLSTGVACLGFVTLAVVTAPTPPGQRALEIVNELVLRGQILIAPPRVATPDDPVAQKPAAGAPVAQASEQALRTVMADLQAGRPGSALRLRQLAEAGMPRAQMQMARLYETGQGGLALDRTEARRWTARAADAGEPVAIHNLAIYYLEGRGGPQDEAMAARLLRRAASMGVADSQFNLALMYETGSGVGRNLVEAYKWFQIAAANGDLKARGHAVALESKLSPRELASVERTVASFTPGEAAPEEAPLIPGAATIAEAQRKLSRLGYYIGPTDGQDAPAYRQAVDAYRRDQQAQVASSGA